MGLRIVVWLGLWLIAGISSAYQPDLKDNLPAPLKPWQDWVLMDQPTYPCPFKAAQFAARHCLWPAYLHINAATNAAQFRLFVQSYASGWVILPGGEGFWPDRVQINESSAQPVMMGGRPALYLSPGRYQVEGIIPWQRIPDTLQIPQDTGLVMLSVQGQTVSLPRRDQGGRLWLLEQAAPTRGETEDKLGISVFRHLQDGVPFQVVTEVQLEVSGSPREMLLGVVRLPDFELAQVESPLPARVEDDGRLRIRLRPGSWTLRFATLQNADVVSLPLPEIDAVWPTEELWSFQPHSGFRQVRIEGAEAVDPNQTRIPDAWKSWKAFRMIPGQALKLVTLQRGDPEPSPNQLELQRTAWLAFAGDAMTFRDQISGSLSRNWRLKVMPGYQLGHVSVQGEPQVVTQMGGQQGVELRQSPINLQAVGQLRGDLSRVMALPAVGWQQDMERLSLDLHMPPGWHLFAASGADRVSNAWLNSWQVWDVFLLLITVAALAKLRGLLVALVSGVALFLIYPEEPAILWLWLNMMAVFALLSVLKSGGFYRYCVLYGRLSTLALIVVCVPFLVSQARMALYPQLEKGYYASASGGQRVDYLPEAQELAPMASVALEAASVTRDMPKRLASKMKSPQPESALIATDPNSAAQTGPSIPAWSWNQASVRWSGPVSAEQTLTLYLMKPIDSRIAAVLRLLLLLVAAAGLYRGWRSTGLQSQGSGPAAARVAGILVPVLLVSLSGMPDAHALASADAVEPAGSVETLPGQGFPSEGLLQQLKERLVSAGNCSPHCVAANRARLQLANGRLALMIEYNALEAVQTPLPDGGSQWQLDGITIDGEPAPVRREGSQLWLVLEPGLQRVLLEGSVTASEAIPLSFPTPVHNLAVVAPGWTVRGLDNGRIRGDALTLEPLNVQRQIQDDSQRLPPNTISPFVAVERHLHLGLNWYVETRVIRLAPYQGAIKLRVPLLAGESVTSRDVTPVNGLVDVVLSPQQRSFTWYASLDKSTTIALTAPRDAPWVERWYLDAAALWHVKPEGIAPVKDSGNPGQWQPQWQPLPGDSLLLQVTRPDAAEGATTTIDTAALRINPGRQDTSYSLTLNLRSSKGTEQRIRLAEQARIVAVTLNGKVQPSQEQGAHLVVPINPGEHTLTIEWREPTQPGFRQRGPELVVDGQLANLDTTVEVPRSRWVLLVDGPRMGPAVLVWGELLVVILIALALARIKGLPLKTYEWVLLAMGLCAGVLEAGIWVVLWFLALRKRGELGNAEPGRWFNLFQVLLVMLTLIAVVVMVGVIPMGLMGDPDMGIVGNGSSHYQLRWYLDHSQGQFPEILWVSLPLWSYRLLMLLWSLWLAVAILRWLRWGWQCFSAGGLWRRIEKDVPEKTTQEKEDAHGN